MKFDENILIYTTLVAVVGLLAYSLFGMPSISNTAQASGGSANLAPNSAAATIPAECGDINDPSNLQHLTHHDNLKPCLKFVDPAKFKQATGQDLSNFVQ